MLDVAGNGAELGEEEGIFLGTAGVGHAVDHPRQRLLGFAELP